MKEVSYTLSSEINGVSELVFYAPTRKNLKFAQTVKQAVMRAAVKQANNAVERHEAAAEASDEGLDGDAILTILQAGDDDVGNLMEKFMTACTDSPMCQANGGPIPKDIWNDMTVSDIEGAFKEYVGNFITI